MSSPAVQFSNVSKSYSIYAAPRDRLKELATFQTRRFHTEFWALRDVSFEVQRGETFCVVGENGSGKSTLLQICAGILAPTSGTAIAHGRVAALLELGSGFNPEFSGKDNVYLNGAILGLSNKDMDRRFPDIEAFAEIGDFIHQPVKTYSSGMAVRLAFAVAIHVDPEILLVDEALAVGDVYFRQRCMRKVHELRQRGVTILFVSHATGDVKALGDRAMWLEKGVVKALGRTDLVVAQYLAAMSEKDRVQLPSPRVSCGGSAQPASAGRNCRGNSQRRSPFWRRQSGYHGNHGAGCGGIAGLLTQAKFYNCSKNQCTGERRISTGPSSVSCSAIIWVSTSRAPTPLANVRILRP